MRSYASVDRIEGKIAVLEVEMITVLESEVTPIGEAETTMIDVEIDKLIEDLEEEVHEGDIIVVEHNGVRVSFTCYLDREEKEARAEYLKNKLL